MDVHNKRKQQTDGAPARSNNLPDIGGGSGAGKSLLPSVNPSGSTLQPTIVLPHSEPLTDELKNKHAHLIQLFGLEIITCFNSQFWSARQAAIDKVNE